jgi:SAM-dependent methyltransferase
VPQVFDAAYYRTFYGRSPIQSRSRVEALASGVFGLAAFWGIPIRSVLEIGAGPGHFSNWVRASRPRIRVVSTDVSDYACRRYGHTRADISAWTPSRPFDLVVAQGVLHYLDDDAAASAIRNLALATRRLLFLEVPTSHDYDHVLDMGRSDLVAHWRAGDWYRSRLAPDFAELGCGLHHRHTDPAPFYELEHAPRS